jgi:hypothetical protein
LPEGSVQVKWDRRRSSDGGDVLHLVWSESAGKESPTAPAPAPEAIREKVASEIEGTVNLSKEPGRAVFEIVVPLSRDNELASPDQ